ncbi:hypothetical protein BDK51DRAFT_27784 [Blyttiomyces helicus]|uniref:Uncharacterized protein n=1 Tax=Blyttiomyces helicus TaxID=388810 RepID=A0A4P9W9N9_9FUNG|nr:hypothetical protein BDK51DRAFT_27784 [Blyttiomyces helicus]|eukprot:RKO89124.1 hypothetical protein BDK51DRAFT_27784 [Blyttiomyces helicus]
MALREMGNPFRFQVRSFSNLATTAGKKFTKELFQDRVKLLADSQVLVAQYHDIYNTVGYKLAMGEIDEAMATDIMNCWINFGVDRWASDQFHQTEAHTSLSLTQTVSNPCSIRDGPNDRSDVCSRLQRLIGPGLSASFLELAAVELMPPVRTTLNFA